MKALVYYGPKDIRISQLEDPKLSEDEVLIKVKACGICGSDVHGYLGITGRRIPPMVMGHEFSGDIREKGKLVENLDVGDRVTVYPVRFCGKCRFCRKGLTNLCENKSFLGVMNINGAMAEYISVPSYMVCKLPESLSYIQGAMVEPLAVAYRAVKNSPNFLNKDVIIVGAGTIGLLVLSLVKLAGAKSITVIDINEYRLEVAKILGANLTVNPKGKDIESKLSRTMDVAFEAVGSTITVNYAMNSLKNGGVSIWIGNSAKNIDVDMQNIVTRELKIIGTYIYTYEEFRETMSILSTIKSRLDQIISGITSLDKAPEVFDKLTQRDNKLVKVMIVF